MKKLFLLISLFLCVSVFPQKIFFNDAPTKTNATVAFEDLSNGIYRIGTNMYWTIGGDSILRILPTGLDVIGNLTLGTITTGGYEATPIADAYISSATNWNTAYGWGDWSIGVTKTFVDALSIDADSLGNQPAVFYDNSGLTLQNITDNGLSTDKIMDVPNITFTNVLLDNNRIMAFAPILNTIVNSPLLISGSNVIADGTFEATSLIRTGGLSTEFLKADGSVDATTYQSLITGAATTITSSDLTINKALQSSGTGKVEVSTITALELSYLSGSTDTIQEQIDDLIIGGGMVYPDAGIALSTGTAWGTSITDNSANWNAAYTHITESGASHTFIDQDVTTTASPTFGGVLTAEGLRNGITNTNYSYIFREAVDASYSLYVQKTSTDALGGNIARFAYGSNAVGDGTAVLTIAESSVDISTALTALGGTSTNWNTAYGWGDWSIGVTKTFVDALSIDADSLGNQPAIFYDNSGLTLDNVVTNGAATTQTIQAPNFQITGTFTGNTIPVVGTLKTFLESPLTVVGSKVLSSDTIQAATIVKTGGLSTEFLKADGSVDASTYLTGNQTITLSGDVSGSGATAITTTIGVDKILESMLKSVNLPTDEYALTYEATTGDFEWQPLQSPITGEALTKIDDTNVTLTLGGSPTSSLLAATSLTLGWAGTLADGRIASATNWNAAYTHITESGASHTFIDQDVTTTASPTFGGILTANGLRNGITNTNYNYIFRNAVDASYSLYVQKTSTDALGGNIARFAYGSNAVGDGTAVLTIAESSVDISTGLTAATLDATNLTTGFIPYDNGTSLVNSPVYTDGTNVGIGTSSPGAKLEVNGGDAKILVQGSTAAAIQLVDNGYTNSPNFEWQSLSGRIRLNYSDDAPTSSLDIMSILSNGNVGIGTASPTEKLDVVGNINVSGTASFGGVLSQNDLTDATSGTTGSIQTDGGVGIAKSLWVGANIDAEGEITAFSTSDRRLKKNIKPLKNALDIINSFEIKKFKWNNKAKELNASKDDRLNYGVIAQELKKTNPELVHNMYGGDYYGVDYVQIIPILVKANQELQQENKKLKARLDKIESMLNLK